MHHYNRAGQRSELRSTEVIPAGTRSLGFAFRRSGEHRGSTELLVDGAIVASGEIESTLSLVISFEGLDVGRDALVSVCDAYKSPFDWTGRLQRVVMTLGDRRGGTPPPGAAAELHRQ